MSSINVYAVFDKKAKMYSDPMLLSNDEVAERTMVSMLLNPRVNYSIFPEDYCMHYIGSYDQNTGEFLDQDNAHLVCEAVDMKGIANEIQKSHTADEPGEEI